MADPLPKLSPLPSPAKGFVSDPDSQPNKDRVFEEKLEKVKTPSLTLVKTPNYPCKPEAR